MPEAIVRVPYEGAVFQLAEYQTKLKNIIDSFGGPYLILPDGQEVRRELSIEKGAGNDDFCLVAKLAKRQPGTIMFGELQRVSFDQIFTVLEQQKILEIFAERYKVSRINQNNGFWQLVKSKSELVGNHEKYVGGGYEKSGKRKLVVTIPPENNPFNYFFNMTRLEATEGESLDIDVIAYIKKIIDFYKQNLLQKWVEEILSKSADVSRLCAEEWDNLVHEISQGAIPIPMPSRLVQRETSFYVGHCLTPKSVVNGRYNRGNGWNVSEDVLGRIYKDNASDIVCAEVPAEPYLLLISNGPDASGFNCGPGARAVGGGVSEHNEFFAQLRSNPGGPQPMSLIEYLVMQSVYTQAVITKINPSDLIRTTILPVDLHSVTRFSYDEVRQVMLAAKWDGSVTNAIKVFFSNGSVSIPVPCVRVVKRIPIGK